MTKADILEEISTMAAARQLVQPDWESWSTLGSPYDVEIDVNASRHSAEKYRIRERRFTGQEQAEWRMAPDLEGL